MKYQFYNELNQDARKIREAVFVEEQGFKNEFDDIDNHCLHLVIYENNQAIGCARMYQKDKTMVLGRIAVIKSKRELHLGSYILDILELKAKELGFLEVNLSAQVRAKNFYIKNDYHENGEEYLDEYCPHVNMKKGLK
ncbi:MAG: GNAT family N-acetyltransferase [Coprobacillus sp.]